jgi:hypothetical protein
MTATRIAAMLGRRISAHGSNAVQVLATLTPLDDHELALSAGGLVDRETACGDSVVLWGDARCVAALHRARTAGEQPRVREPNAA